MSNDTEKLAALIRGREQDAEPRVRHTCNMGVGCEETGICYAAANGAPERCGRPDAERGLYEKYKVERTDGSSAPGGKHHVCEYFVLDTTHDPFAFAALGAYADACEDAYPKLAADLRERYELKPTAIAKYKMICEAFDGMSTSESERFLECLGVDGDVLKPLDEVIMAALSRRAEGT